jgi:hypothetical protein
LPRRSIVSPESPLRGQERVSNYVESPLTGIIRRHLRKAVEKGTASLQQRQELGKVEEIERELPVRAIDGKRGQYG